MSAAGDKYIESLKSEVARSEAEKQAIIQEFTKIAGEELTPEEIREKVKTELLPAAWASLQELILNANDGIRANLSRWVIEFSSRPAPGEGEVDPDKALTKLLKELVVKE